MTEKFAFANLAAAAVLLAVGVAAPPAKALQIVLTDDGSMQAGGAQGALAWAGYQEAARIWESTVSDDIVVRIQVSFSALGGGQIGHSAVATGSNFSYSTVRNALIADATSVDDTRAIANLQAGPNLSFVTSSTCAGCALPRVLDNGSTTNNTTLSVPRPIAKALGLLADTGSSDGTSTLDSSGAWDFVRSDGISGGRDFVGVALHEFGHVMGFQSGVDQVDALDGGASLQNLAIVKPLDLFRYYDSGTAGTSGPTMDIAVGPVTGPYFSIDGGTTDLASFTTGSSANGGDGQQASHWKAGGTGGLMKSSLGSGILQDFEAWDLQAFDAMGFDRCDVTGGCSALEDNGEGLLSGTPVVRDTFDITKQGGLSQTDVPLSDITYVTYAAVAAPPSLALFAGFAAALGFAARRRRFAAKPG